MNPLSGGALGSNIAEKKRVQALVWRSHTLSVLMASEIRQIWRRVIFAVLSQSAKTANIMRLENLALYGIHASARLFNRPLQRERTAENWTADIGVSWGRE